MYELSAEFHHQVSRSTSKPANSTYFSPGGLQVNMQKLNLWNNEIFYFAQFWKKGRKILKIPFPSHSYCIDILSLWRPELEFQLGCKSQGLMELLQSLIIICPHHKSAIAYVILIHSCWAKAAGCIGHTWSTGWVGQLRQHSNYLPKAFLQLGESFTPSKKNHSDRWLMRGHFETGRYQSRKPKPSLEFTEHPFHFWPCQPNCVMYLWTGKSFKGSIYLHDFDASLYPSELFSPIQAITLQGKTQEHRILTSEVSFARSKELYIILII